eukprot:m.1227446 g.1227446  ORF g.1227446 m.1227446 type:complete len:97 (+) comp24643_c1_seq6:199-489(+)
MHVPLAGTKACMHLFTNVHAQIVTHKYMKLFAHMHLQQSHTHLHASVLHTCMVVAQILRGHSAVEHIHRHVADDVDAIRLSQDPSGRNHCRGSDGG